MLLARAFTTFFICGALLYITDRALVGAQLFRRLRWGCWWAMLVGLVRAAVTILTNNATVLYTFYPHTGGGGRD